MTTVYVVFRGVWDGREPCEVRSNRDVALASAKRLNRYYTAAYGVTPESQVEAFVVDRPAEEDE